MISMSNDITKAPRIYIPDDVKVGADIPLSSDLAHYLLTVMRKGMGDMVRVFNGRDGEYAAALDPQSKKSAHVSIVEQMREQPPCDQSVHLYFAPIKKDRMAFMIEKAVELGVTDLHPVITANTQHGKMNTEKMTKQIIEAAEQCERMTIPVLHDAVKLSKVAFVMPTFAAIERMEAPIITAAHNQDKESDIGILVGPEGGFTKDEVNALSSQDGITPISLGDTILRAETAALFVLSRIVQ